MKENKKIILTKKESDANSLQQRYFKTIVRAIVIDDYTLSYQLLHEESFFKWRRMTVKRSKLCLFDSVMLRNGIENNCQPKFSSLLLEEVASEFRLNEIKGVEREL